MKIVILAAGIGSRLGFEIPKALVNLDRNTTILDFQINLLKGYFNLSDIIIVVGYKKNRVVIFPSDRFHSRYPRESWGTTKEDGRLLFVMFFSIK